MSWLFQCLSAILLALNLALFSTAASVNYQVRNAPGASTADTYLAVRNAIAEAAIQKRDVYSGNATIARRWTDATLLKLGHERTAFEIQARPIDVGGVVEIICTECYVKGTAFAHLHIDPIDPVAQIKGVISNFMSDVQNITDGFATYVIGYVVDYIENVDVGQVIDNVLSDGPDWEDLELPTFNYTMDLDIPEIPECKLKFQFDGMELYMNMNTILEAGATYELPLYRSQTPLGLFITQELNLGVFFTFDLILSVEGQIDISSGFHIKLEDGIAIEIALFGDDVSDVTFPGGQFEFLPVVIESGGIVFSAILRLGVHAGFELATPDLKSLDAAGNALMPRIAGGIEVGIFANVAEFITNITYTPEEDCKRNVVQSYKLALGAKAGATVAIGNNTWGPMPETSKPIWYTEMASLCAGEKAPATVTSGAITTAISDQKRQDLITTTATMKFIHTGVNCLHIGLVNCPASLQNTSQSTEIRTIITAIPSGSEFTFPTTVMDTVPSPIAFRKDAVAIPATAGSPVSYVPPQATPTLKLDDFVDDAIADVETTFENNKKLILGLAFGLGIPFLLAIIAGLIFCQRRRTATKHIAIMGTSSASYSAPKMVNSPTTLAMSQGYMDYEAVKTAYVEEAELGAPSPR